MKVPILRHANVLLTSFQDDLTDRDAIDLQFDLLEMIEQLEAKAVLMDVSSLEFLDSYQAKMISETAAMARILGCRVVLSGVQPKVAVTLVELGDVITGVETVLNIERGMTLLADEIKFEDIGDAGTIEEEVSDDHPEETTDDVVPALKPSADLPAAGLTATEAAN